MPKHKCAYRGEGPEADGMESCREEIAALERLERLLTQLEQAEARAREYEKFVTHVAEAEPHIISPPPSGKCTSAFCWRCAAERILNPPSS